MRINTLFIGILVSQVLQANLGSGAYSLNGVDCKRECKWPAEPAVCRFNFTIDWYYSMSKACYDCPFNLTHCESPGCIPLNGVKRGILVANKQFPGPSIEVCEGDTIEVEAINNLPSGEGTALHWHGLHVRESPYMDGVTMITQCPITSYTNFLYWMKADPAGTHWWHSHAGFQRADGLFGALIVRQAPSRDIHSSKYDYDLSEHTMLVHDLQDQLWLNTMSGFLHGEFTVHPDTMIINGKGKRRLITNEEGNVSTTPREVFHIAQGNRYRFRSISNVVFNCLLRISIDNHTMTIIATDGAPVEPFETDSFLIGGGERFDFVLNANQPIGNYWVRVEGMIPCEMQQELAILRYQGAPDVDPDPNQYRDIWDFQGKTVNSIDGTTEVQMTELVSAEEDDKALGEPDKQFYMAVDIRSVNNDRYHDPVYYPLERFGVDLRLEIAQLNEISFLLPPSPPLTQYDDLGEDQFCTKETAFRTKNCTAEYCECTQILEVDLGDVVELVVVNEGSIIPLSHPMHLHGFHFRFIGQGKIGDTTTVEEVKAMDKAGNLTRKLHGAVRKDTLVVSDGGYAILRFHADNPGWWMFHCHLVTDFKLGMGVVIRVGEQSDLPEVPPNFPRCGSFDGQQRSEGENIQDKPGSASTVLIHIYVLLFFFICIKVV